MQVRLPTGSDIAEMLLLCAKPDELNELELSKETFNEFVCIFDELNNRFQIDLIAVALYYCNRTITNYIKSESLTRELYFSPEIIRNLVKTVQIEEYIWTDKLINEIVSLRNKRNREAGHKENKEKANKIRALWATGKYTSRNICAEQECDALGMKYETARKALRNTPDPT